VIYLEETYDLNPATPTRRDQFVAFAEHELAPVYGESGARLVAAWNCDSERWGRLTQILEFDNFTTYENYRLALAGNQRWSAISGELQSLAPVQQHRLLEPLVPNFVPVLHRAIQSSQGNPLRQYMLAILEVAPGMMELMRQGLSAVADSQSLPIVMSWRLVSGKQNTVIDLWKSSLQRPGYQTQDEYTANGIDDDWWTNLRLMAPEEKIVFLDPLPYSPLA
jgi:hypothetical protein